MNNFDGGTLQGMDSECSCSGGETIKVQSYVDDSQHVYLYQPGVTTLDMNYNIMSSGNYFLTTLFPFAMCLDASEDCEGSSGQQPSGIFLEIGTSLRFDKNSLMAFLDQFPGATQLSGAVTRAFSPNQTTFPSLSPPL
ncbi:hypothetical protein KGQ27_00290 [Patescibacteria group bacterium]|nr:hypothetical protein [Patescibacteria group bacterium]MDE1946655.1 hypothetical protein [Patescibacteria group bacterium]MDE2010608.1 hypothetical protein [Patescibacteria group bacterium]